MENIKTGKVRMKDKNFKNTGTGKQKIKRGLFLLGLCLMLVGLAACGRKESDQIEADQDVAEDTAQEEGTTQDSLPVVVEESEYFNIRLSFAGDMVLTADKYNTRSDNFHYYTDNYPKEYFLEKVKHIFEGDDFTCVNLENVLSDRDLAARNKGEGRAFWFKGPTENIEILTCASVEGVTLANNHTLDYGEEGRADTIEAVEQAGLLYGLEEKILYYEKNGFRIAVICNGLWGEWQASEIISLIQTAEEHSDYQIVFYHGGTEGAYEPEAWRVRASRSLADHGADLVIGNHPHVLQPREIYNGVEIIYSLGNFCYGGHSQPKNRTMIYQMNLLVDKETLELKAESSEIIPCYVYTGSGNNNFQPAIIMDEDTKQRVLDFMNGLTGTPQ